MITVAVVCLVVAAVAIVICATLAIRPALQVRAVLHRLQAHPTLALAQNATATVPSLSVAAARFNAANRSFSGSAVAMDSAFRSAGSYAGQVAAMSLAIDNLLEFLVPRLRGMTE